MAVHTGARATALQATARALARCCHGWWAVIVLATDNRIKKAVASDVNTGRAHVTVTEN